MAVNSSGWIVTSKNCSGLRRIFFVARQAMADASERLAMSSTLLERAESDAQLRTAWLAAVEGLAAGADEGKAQDLGFMRSRSFADPDGHAWEVLWMDPIAQTGDWEAVQAKYGEQQPA